MENKKLGDMAEAAARAVYRDKGYRILAYNLHYGKIGELDIVAYTGKKDNGILVFCEVKCRRDISFADPASAVNRKKQNRIRTLAEIFIQRHPEFELCDVRFDVADITPEQGHFSVTLLENAF